MTLGLSGITTANLTDTSSGGNTFTITGWTGKGTLTGTAGHPGGHGGGERHVDQYLAGGDRAADPDAERVHDRQPDRHDRRQHLHGQRLDRDRVADRQCGHRRHGDGKQERRLYPGQHLAVLHRWHDARLERNHDRQPHRHRQRVNTFTVTGWTGSGTLKGSTETLVDSVSSSVVLANTSLAVTGLPTLTLSGFTTANLTDTAGGNTFTVSGWTGSGSLTDSASTADTVTASKSASFTLANTSLSSTDGMTLGLSGITTANLAATSSGKTFTVSGWTGSGSLTDTATGIVTASKNAGFTLTNTSLSSTDGMTLGLSGITTANLTTTATSGSPSYIVDASAFTGVTNLTAGGTVNAILFGGSANGSTLSATGSGNDVLIGGSGKDTLTDTGTGYNILIGGPGADTITGNGNDILISGTTSYDSNTSANIAALDAILAEWSSSDSYSLRISKIMSGVGPGGTDALNSSTCQSDGVANTVSDGASSTQNNWFIVNSKDKVTKQSNETETIV